MFYANESQGTIGKEFASEGENPYDNFFTVNLPDTLRAGQFDVYMAYDLYGLSEAGQTTKSFNNHPAYGGSVITRSEKWVSVNEAVPAGYLKPGVNEVFFNRREEQGYKYKIKNLRFELKKKNTESLSVAGQALVNYNGVVYVTGTVADDAVTAVRLYGKSISVTGNVFEATLENVPAGTKELTIKYVSGSAEKQVEIPVRYDGKDPAYRFAGSALENNSKMFAYDSAIIYDNLTIDIKKGLLDPGSKVRISGLYFKDIRTLNDDVDNVTSGTFQGYRIEKVNIEDSVGIHLHMKYDDEKIPEGYTAKDIKTFYFDPLQHSWKALQTDSLDIKNQEVISTAYGEGTDYINGVIKVPDSPETGSFAPTTISDMKYADPAAGIISIPPPSPNSTGAAATSFPIKLPQGRNGMQPSLQVGYNSEAGNGWMGIGWNLVTPAITLNTKWGVPRFEANESELYSLNGSDLVLKLNDNTNTYTNPHRQANIARMNGRQFYERKEGSYNKIIRGGSSPLTYYWVVTDKMGNKSYYGGYNAVDNNCVARTGGLTSGNIAHWALKRTEDPYGNHVDYTYEKGTEDINGVTAQYFYVSQIDYTLKDNSITNFYRVKFIRSNGRNDKTTNARNGYVQITNALLSEVQVYLVQNSTQETLIRRYGFNYYSQQDAAVFSNPFQKSVLKSISEYDATGDLFYSHTMEYYDQVGTGAIIDSGSIKSFDGDEDSVAPLGVLSGIALGSEGSALGTSTSVGGTGGFRAGFGLGFNVLSVTGTIGGSLNYSFSENNTQVSFIDINGDGLPDKVYKDGNSIKYRPNLGLTNGSGHFGDYITISGLNALGKTTSNTVGYGGDLNLSIIGVGKSGSNSWSQTDNYFDDFNGDGLPDMVTNGQIKFNATLGTDSDNRAFTLNSGATENAVTPGQFSTQVLSSMDLPTEAELRASYPQFDHVKVWQAPYTGAAFISGTAYLEQLNSCGSTNDFRLTVEWSHKVNGSWVTTVLNTIPHFNTSSYNIPAVTQPVTKGDLLFFRIHNNGYGCGGRIKWNPLVSYTSTANTELNYNASDENGNGIMNFVFANDFVINNGGTTDVGNTAVTLNASFNLTASVLLALHLSDAITFTIQRIRYNTEDSSVAPVTYTYQRVFDPLAGLSGNNGSNTLSIPMNFSLGTNERDVLYCYAESDSNIDWSALQWKPTYTVSGSSEVHYPGVTSIPFSDNVAQKKYWITSAEIPNPVIDANDPNDSAIAFMVMSHNFDQVNWQSYLNLSNTATPAATVLHRKVSWVVKRQVVGVTSTILYKKTFYLNKVGSSYFLSRNADGSLPLSTADADYTTFFSFKLPKSDVQSIKNSYSTLYSAFYIDNPLIGGQENNFNPATITFSLDPAFTNNSQYAAFQPITLNSPFLAQNAPFWGYNYRGWGEFLYNGGINSDDQSDYGLQPIDAALFDQDTQAGSAQTAGQADENTSPDDAEAMSSGLTIRYTLYQQQNGSSLYTQPSIKYRATTGDVDVTFGPDSQNNLVATMGRFGIADIYSQYIDINSQTTNTTGVFSGLKLYSEAHGSAVSGNAGIPQLSYAGTYSSATSKLKNQYIDFNGDRYPDLVTPGAIQFTGMFGGFTTTTLFDTSIPAMGSDSEDKTPGRTIAGLFPGSTMGAKGVRVLTGTIPQVNSGINSSNGITKNGNQWLDMNGDGLTDKVYLDTDGNRVVVHLNTGYNFSPQETNWITNTGNMNISSNGGSSVTLTGSAPIATSSLAFGLGAVQNTSDIETLFLDVNGDGLVDLVRRNSGNYIYYLNTGTGFTTTPSTFYNSNVADQDHTLSANLFGSYTFGFAIPIPFLPIALKTTFTPTLSVTAGYSEKRHALQDIDGDGLADVLHQANNSNAGVNANLNRVGKTYLLKKVNTPLGGSWTVDYERVGNTYQMPMSKWVLNEVRTYDGFTADNQYKPDNTLASINYELANYSRREREFLGFGKVTVKQEYPDTGNTYRRSESDYHNENYYLSGALKRNAVYDVQDNLLSEENTLYNLLNPANPVINMGANNGNNYLQAGLSTALLDQSRLLIAVAKVTSTSYEGTDGITATKEFTSYDLHGNLKTFIDRGTGPDDAYRSVIDYYPSIGSLDNSVGFPNKISVYKNSTNVLMRYRESTYNSLGKLSMVTTKLNDADYNEVSFTYDSYGNTSAVNYPDVLDSDDADAFSKSMEYDPLLHTYPILFSNSYGESSSVVYNYLFGVPVLTTDVNGQLMRSRIDDRGRVTEVTGPNEMALESNGNNANAWTIRMRYEGEAEPPGNLQIDSYLFNAAGHFDAVLPGQPLPTGKQHYALTRHFDPEFANSGSATSTNQLLTISISDGFGQPIQVKKTHQSTAMKWMVSGFEVKDAFGRVTQSYLPAVQAYATDINALSAADTGYYSVDPTSLPVPLIMEYDTKDRTVSITQPGESSSAALTYSIEGGLFKQHSVNELGQTADAFTDVRGRQVKSVQNDAITTTFDYNAINELLKVTDNQGFITSYKYDLAGRKAASYHPDRGATTFKYDEANRVTEQSNSNLLQNGSQHISYKYNFGRLVSVLYPQNPQNNVEYTYGQQGDDLATDENAVGRLLMQKDATGVQVFGYGHMGELTKNLRSVAVAGYQSYWFFTQWKYDSFNRVQEITYPDQEVISYRYNAAGMLQGIDSTIPGINNGPAENQQVVGRIDYDNFGDRKNINYGNGTVTNYKYDVRRRMKDLIHNFTNFNIDKQYTYDALSNITGIESFAPQNSLPATGTIGGPVSHAYTYDNYNRLTHAEGGYTGPDDLTTPYLRQQYTLDMAYNPDHTIKAKTQHQWLGPVNSSSDPLAQTDGRPVKKTSYTLNYEDYATGAYVVGNDEYGYQQPHAVRTVNESPSWVDNLNDDDPRNKHIKLLYDANGNQVETKDVVGEIETSTRKNLWDEENRLRAVNLKPDDPTRHPLAIYTYDAGGERTIRYNYDRIDVSSNAKEVAEQAKDNVMLYPSGLIMGKASHLSKGNTMAYTKHYYIGSERISAKTGTLSTFGSYPLALLQEQMPDLTEGMVRPPSNDRVATAGTAVNAIHDAFGVPHAVLDPYAEGSQEYAGHQPNMLNIFYFHPDHLGSSSYITNKAGIVSQHMEYLPFGETLVDEHLNSNNSPFKFNGKEFDEETGNYYYGARYYDPKLSNFISVDPLADKYPGVSAYAYCMNNPINMVDPTGMETEEPYDFYRNKETGEIEWFFFDQALEGYDHIGSSYNENGRWGYSDSNGTHAVQGGIDGSFSEETYGSDLHTVEVECYRDKVSSTPWMDIARSQLGVTELTNKNDGVDVEKYLQSGGLGKGNPWCGAFVNWSLLNAGVSVDGVNGNPNWALNWRGFGQVLTEPAYGAIASKKRHGGGHVGFVAGMTPNGNIVLLAGNQSDKVSYESFLPSSLKYNFPNGYTPNYDLPIIDNKKKNKKMD